MKKIISLFLFFSILFSLNKLQTIDPFENSESGFIQINQTSDSNFFYWYFESHQNPSNAPIILWLEGNLKKI